MCAKNCSNQIIKQNWLIRIPFFCDEVYGIDPYVSRSGLPHDVVVPSVGTKMESLGAGLTMFRRRS